MGVKKQKWGYDEHNGPAVWKDLSQEYFLCETGLRQSPINIERKLAIKDCNILELNYKLAQFQIEKFRNSINFKSLKSDNKIIFNEEEYYLQGIHFHIESEHALDGKKYPFEGHYVHESKKGETLVIGVFYDIGEDNIMIGNNFNQIGKEAYINPFNSIPSESKYYYFNGSLTTPPCVEGVKWIVFEKKVNISLEQIESFTKIYSKNNRPLQKLNGRKIKFNKFEKK